MRPKSLASPGQPLIHVVYYTHRHTEELQLLDLHPRPPQRRTAGKLLPLLLSGGIDIQGENALVHRVWEGATLVAPATAVAAACGPALPRPTHPGGRLPVIFCRRGRSAVPSPLCSATSCGTSP